MAELRLVGAARPERADAARNRGLVLAAAAQLFARSDPREVTMDAVAKAAGVGRATLYRRYPDVRSIAVALLDEHERELQEQLLRGDPPLGPGADPAQRLMAFFGAMLDLLERFLPLVLGAETGRARFTSGAYGFWRAHVGSLLAAAGIPDAANRADLLLAPLDPEFVRFQRETRELDRVALLDQLRWLVSGVLATASVEAVPKSDAAPKPAPDERR